MMVGMSTTINQSLEDLKRRLAGMGVNVNAPLPEPERPVQQEIHFSIGQQPAAAANPARPIDDRQATQQQVDYIKRLAAERNITMTQGGKEISSLSTQTPGLTHRRVQQVIEFLSAQPVVKPRRNRLPQDCAECERQVPAWEGVLTNEGGRWVVRHDGVCPDETSMEIARINDSFDEVEGLDLSVMLPGMYADPTSDGDLKLRIERGVGNLAEFTYVRDGAVYGYGAEYGAQIPGASYRGGVVDHLRAIAADPIGAMARYGQITSTCGLCGRKLEDRGTKGPDGLSSVERGIGPICYQKLLG